MLNSEKFEIIRKHKKIKDPNTLAPAQLAYIGDAIYEIIVRDYLINEHDYNTKELHKAAIKFVRADAQANFLFNLEEMLSEEEKRITKRGRNAKITSISKNANMKDYRYATGLEALFGYLFLNNEINRLLTIFDKIVEIREKAGDKN